VLIPAEGPGSIFESAGLLPQAKCDTVLAMTAYLIIFIFIAVGFGLQRVPWIPAQSAHWLNQVAIFVCLPALILIHVPSLSLDLSLLPLVIVPWALLLASIVLVLPLVRWMGWSREVEAVLLVLLPLGNTSFLGFPLVEALLGEAFLPLAVVYDQFGSFLMVSTHVLWVVAWYGADQTPSVKLMAKRLFQFPPFLALVIALVFGHEWLGDWGWTAANWFAGWLLPIVTLAIGLSLHLRLPRQYVGPLVFGVGAKLVLLPAITVGMVWWMSTAWVVAPAVARVALLEAAMPAMITASALLSRAGLAPALSTAMVAWSVLLSVLTVPIWHWVGLWVWGAI